MTPSSEPAGLTTVTTPGAPDPTGHNWLALVGFLLSLSPLGVWALAIVLNGLLFPSIPEEAAFYHVYDQYYSQYFHAMLLIGLISVVRSVSALITSGSAISRANQYWPHQSWRRLAKIGRGVGLIGIFVGVVIIPCGYLAVAAGNYRGG
jgi:hypothetical protein